MSKNKYDFEVTDIDALAAFAKNAVITVKKASRSAITKMLDAGIVNIPGVKLKEPTESKPITLGEKLKQGAKD